MNYSKVRRLKDKVILTDCDGVLLDWEYKFHQWMHRKGFERVKDADQFYHIEEQYSFSKEFKQQIVKQFNECATIGHLTPLRDAVHYVRKLHEQHGYMFHVITAQTDDPYAQQLRIENLKRVFGENVFERFVILDTGAEKHEALSEYKDSECFWVEDHIHNVEVGISLGLTGVLMSHTHNRTYDGCLTVHNWKQIYNHIVG